MDLRCIVFNSDGSCMVFKEWPRTNTIANGLHMYRVSNDMWYICRNSIAFDGTSTWVHMATNKVPAELQLKALLLR